MPKQRHDPTPLLPLTPVVLHILVALAEGDGHGYGISRDVEKQTKGAVRLGPGTLYGSLQRMSDAGLIVEVTAPRAAYGSHAERRRYYGLTALGRRALRADAERLAAAVRLTRARLGSEASNA